MEIIHLSMEPPVTVTPEFLAVNPVDMLKSLIKRGGKVNTYTPGEVVDITPLGWRSEGSVHTLHIDEQDPAKAVIKTQDNPDNISSTLTIKPEVHDDDTKDGDTHIPGEVDLMPLLRYERDSQELSLGALIFRGRVDSEGAVELAPPYQG